MILYGVAIANLIIPFAFTFANAFNKNKTHWWNVGAVITFISMFCGPIRIIKLFSDGTTGMYNDFIPVEPDFSAFKATV